MRSLYKTPFGLAAIAILLFAAACTAHMTGACVVRLANGDIRLITQHWHSGNPGPDTVTTFTLTSVSASDSGLYDNFVSGCGALCPTTCTEAATCGSTTATEGAWYVDLDDTPPRYTPGEVVYMEVLNGGATMAPTGNCDTIGTNGYGVDEGSGISLVIPPPRTSCFADICGDGAVSPPEQCDGSDLGGASCTSLGFDAGTLSCGTCCTYDTSQCLTCNDAVATPVLSGCEPSVVTLQALPGACCETHSFSVTASDADETASGCGAPSVVQTGGPPSGSCFGDGDVVQWTATDSAGNVASCSWQYQVDDTQPPTFAACPSSASGSVGQPISYGAVEAADNCPGTVIIQDSGPANGTTVLTPGTYPVSYTVQDASGLTATCAFDLILVPSVLYVYQETSPMDRVPANADPNTIPFADPLILYMYLPNHVMYGANHQSAFGYQPADGAYDYFQIREQNSPTAVYQSEPADTASTNPLEYEHVFTGLHSLISGSDYELWACMTGGGGDVCIRIYVKVSVCPSPYSPFPPECVYSPLGNL